MRNFAYGCYVLSIRISAGFVGCAIVTTGAADLLAIPIDPHGTLSACGLIGVVWSGFASVVDAG